jgi:hypothetical protein
MRHPERKHPLIARRRLSVNLKRSLVRGSREASEARLIPLASTCPVAWRYLMRHVSLHPSSFALPLWLRPRSSGHRHMPRQNRLRPALRSRRKISRRAMGEEDGASFNLASLARVFGRAHQYRARPARRTMDRRCGSRAAAARPSASCDNRSAGKRVRPRRYFSADGRPKLTLREWFLNMVPRIRIRRQGSCQASAEHL